MVAFPSAENKIQIHNFGTSAEDPESGMQQSQVLCLARREKEELSKAISLTVICLTLWRHSYPSTDSRDYSAKHFT